MIQTDRNILIQETEIKPNTYSCAVLLVSLLCVLGSWILNELGIFRVGDTEMRIGTIIPTVILSSLLITLWRNKRLLANRRTKYFTMAGAIVFTFSVYTLMTFHTTIMLLYPMFMAMLYRSRKLGIVALCGATFCTIVCPILGYAIGAWDIDLFKELILIGTNGTAEIIGAYPGVTAISIFKIFLYIVIPRIMMGGSCAILMFHVIKLGYQHVENQIALNRINQHDALTGLYNQNFFKELLKQDMTGAPIGVIFFDVNGLKRINDSLGHEHGDLLLKRCAKSIADICETEEESAFRIGGDEFLLILENAKEDAVLKKIGQWKEALARVNAENREMGIDLTCSMAVGYAMGHMKDLQEIVREADTRMYQNKAEYKAVCG